MVRAVKYTARTKRTHKREKPIQTEGKKIRMKYPPSGMIKSVDCSKALMVLSTVAVETNLVLITLCYFSSMAVFQEELLL